METAPSKKPHLSFWQIWNMSFGFLGIQFGFALQNANVSRIFETLGAAVEDIPILWVAAPLTGLIVQPIVGHFSDKTWNRLGRRRPFFLVGAILASLALFIMPNSPVLWVAAGMLWIMDASINISMEPFRAFVGDMLPSEQRTSGFAMQSFFIGTGAVVASMLPWMLTNWFGISNTAPEGIIPDSVKFSFYLGGAAFFLAVLWTVLKSKEYSPEELARFEEAEQHALGIDPKLAAAESAYDFSALASKQSRYAIVSIVVGSILTFLIYNGGYDQQLYIIGGGTLVFGIIMVIASIIQSKGNTTSGLVEVMNDMLMMPKAMLQLAVVQFFSWFALFAMWIYTTNAVTAHIYGTHDTTSALYNDGADWVGFSFAVYNGVAALVAFLLPVMAKYTSRKMVHTICLTLGGFSLISIYFITNPDMLLVSMIGIGLAWASILAMPYAILTGSLPAHKMGVYMGIFNFFIVIPQLVAASILGFMVKNLFGGEAIFALVIGGVAMILAGIFTFWVQDDDDKVAKALG